MDFLEGIKKKLMEGSIDIDPKVTKLVNDNFWELAEGVKMGEKMTEEELHQWAKDNGYVKDGRDE